MANNTTSDGGVVPISSSRGHFTNATLVTAMGTSALPKHTPSRYPAFHNHNHTRGDPPPWIKSYIVSKYQQHQKTATITSRGSNTTSDDSGLTTATTAEGASTTVVTPYNLIGTVDVTLTNTIVQTATCDCTDTSLDSSASPSHGSSTSTIATTSSGTLPVAYTTSITAIGSPAAIAYDSNNSFPGSNARTTSAASPSRSAITYSSSPNVNTSYPPLPDPRPNYPSGNAATTGSDGYATSLMTVTVALPPSALSSALVQTLLVITSPSPSKRLSTKPEFTLHTLTVSVIPVPAPTSTPAQAATTSSSTKMMPSTTSAMITSSSMSPQSTNTPDVSPFATGPLTTVNGITGCGVSSQTISAQGALSTAVQVIPCAPSSPSPTQCSTYQSWVSLGGGVISLSTITNCPGPDSTWSWETVTTGTSLSKTTSATVPTRTHNSTNTTSPVATVSNSSEHSVPVAAIAAAVTAGSLLLLVLGLILWRRCYRKSYDYCSQWCPFHNTYWGLSSVLARWKIVRRRNNEVRKWSASGSSGEGVLTGDGRHKGKRVEGDRAEHYLVRWRREREERLEKIRARDEEERKAGKGVYWHTVEAATENSEKTLLAEEVRRWELEKVKARAGSPLGHVKWGAESGAGSASDGVREMKEAYRAVETHPAMTHSVRSPTMPSVGEVVRRSDDSGDSWERRWHALGTQEQSTEQNRHSIVTGQSQGSVEQGRAAIDERSWLNDRRDWI